MNKVGCHKCDFTGFSWGKIPCECRIAAKKVEQTADDKYAIYKIIVDDTEKDDKE